MDDVTVTFNQKDFDFLRTLVEFHGVDELREYYLELTGQSEESLKDFLAKFGMDQDNI